MESVMSCAREHPRLLWECFTVLILYTPEILKSFFIYESILSEILAFEIPPA